MRYHSSEARISIACSSDRPASTGSAPAHAVYFRVGSEQETPWSARSGLSRGGTRRRASPTDPVTLCRAKLTKAVKLAKAADSGGGRRDTAPRGSFAPPSPSRGPRRYATRARPAAAGRASAHARVRPLRSYWARALSLAPRVGVGARCKRRAQYLPSASSFRALVVAHDASPVR